MDYVLPRGHSIEVRFAGGESKKLCCWEKSFTAADVKKLIASDDVAKIAIMTHLRALHSNASVWSKMAKS